MNRFKYIISEDSDVLNAKDYRINIQERFLQQFYIKTVKIGSDDNFYIYRESNPFNKSTFGSKIFKMKR